MDADRDLILAKEADKHMTETTSIDDMSSKELFNETASKSGLLGNDTPSGKLYVIMAAIGYKESNKLMDGTLDLFEDELREHLRGME